jgi:PAS domain S-box-containing protein
MNSEPNNGRSTPWIARRGALVLAAYAFAGGLVTFVGWFAHVPPLTDWVGSGIAMFANTALAASCAGAAIILAAVGSAWARYLSKALGTFVFVIGGATVFQHISGMSLGIDTLLVREPWGLKAAIAPGRMGPPASTCFTLIGIGLMLLTSRGSRRIAPVFGILVAVISMLSLIGYVFGAQPMFAVAHWTGIAFQTATILFALGIAIVASVPEAEPMRTLSQRSAAGVLVQRTVPVMFALCVTLGWLRVRGQEAGLFDTAMGTAMLVSTELILLSALLWWCADAVANREHQQKQVEEALRESAARLSGLVNSAMDAVIAVDEAQRIVLFNPAAEKMFCITEAEALRSSLDRFIPARLREAHRGHIQKFGQTGVTARRMGALGALSGLRANGEEFPIEASISQMEVDGRKLFTVILRDITERKKTEGQLQQAHEQLADRAVQLEKLVQDRTTRLRETIAELEGLSYSIAHDMRAPLRAMGSFAELLLEDPPGASPGARELCRRIVTSASRLDKLIGDALHYTKAVLTELPLEPVDLSQLLRDLIDTYPNLDAAKADIRIDPPLPRVLGNESLLTQCFSNLLGNAVKFVAPGTRPQVRVWAEMAEQNARIWIQDNGIGIPKHAQPRLFGMFEKLDSQYEGTGIGLAIVRKVTERMGGRVGVESEPGNGSRFWVELRLVSM